MSPSSTLPKLCLLLMLLASAGEAKAPHKKLFNVQAFGAVSDGTTDCSQALLSAWKGACEWDGYGVVLIPYGTFLVHPVELKGYCKNITVVRVMGVVKAPRLSKFSNSRSWIHFQYIEGLRITGPGKFDGQGALAWPYNNCNKNENCMPLPMSLSFSFVNDTVIRGISSLDSKFFHFQIYSSHNIKIQFVNITAPADSPNTDGIHIALSSGIIISRSFIGTGDDCISIGPGSFNISINKVFCGPGHGISIGSLGRNPEEGKVEGLSVKNCTFTNTDNGVRIKTWAGSPSHSFASNMTFENIVMDRVHNPIVIDQNYCPYPSCEMKTPSLVKIENVSFKNIRGTSATQLAVKLSCSKGMPCENVELRDIILMYRGKGKKSRSTASCSNVKGISYGQQIPPSCLPPSPAQFSFAYQMSSAI